MVAKTDDTATMISRRKSAILDAWMQAQLASKTLRPDLMSREELFVQSREFLDAFQGAVSTGNFTDTSAPEYRPVLRLLEDISISRTRQGFSPAETAMYVFSLKDTLLAFLQEAHAGQPDILNREVIRLSKLLDTFGLLTFDAYVRGREEIIHRQQQELLELSTPVIKVWEGVLTLPLIGTLDSARTQVVMESLLQQIVATGASIAILDISGVPAVDTLVAQHLLKTVAATRLMGAECIISGIRPEIAQTMVGLGVDLSGVRTRASMADALKESLKALGLRIQKGETGADRK
ncbi:anti-sigma-factor antagonist [Solidesulfovibrio carbinoliphilus subsp. oakridgensis]|uniref:Anti-sigma-factor antagonist n=1 Tax=Solidesulfovibrio carbinoliphilus subsp. oakridgensis TaxID=694327 RepID=G7Q6I9_9BACT|nr:STAS domain-containing protein [Solidesulfovibrio carbinoliphilus]EHJ47602.1 anti-sigma-factor antagonist [Solidesulfovibrio carbinoliphilus subsp. oakridgensis]